MTERYLRSADFYLFYPSEHVRTFPGFMGVWVMWSQIRRSRIPF